MIAAAVLQFFHFSPHSFPRKLCLVSRPGFFSLRWSGLSFVPSFLGRVFPGHFVPPSSPPSPPQTGLRRALFSLTLRRARTCRRFPHSLPSRRTWRHRVPLLRARPTRAAPICRATTYLRTQRLEIDSCTMCRMCIHIYVYALVPDLVVVLLRCDRGWVAREQRHTRRSRARRFCRLPPWRRAHVLIASDTVQVACTHRHRGAPLVVRGFTPCADVYFFDW